MGQEQVEILLVEDNADDVELALHALRRGGLANHVEIARDGDQALDFLFCRGAYADRSSSNPPRVVLLDLKLPKTDGLQVLQEIKSNPRTKAIPVVILTASRQEEDLIKSYRLGVNSYIQKPVDFEQFRVIVKQIGMFWLVVNQPPPQATFEGN
ncbi:MAG: response regulator [Terriglobales bacterium]